MKEKERTILVIKAMIKAEELTSDEAIIEKLDACMDLKRPNKVLLTDQSKSIYNELVKEERRKGKIA